jgi:hypothetical protein
LKTRVLRGNLNGYPKLMWVKYSILEYSRRGMRIERENGFLSVFI